MSKQWNSDKGYYEEGTYEDGAFVAFDDDYFPEPIDDIVDDVPDDDSPVGVDAVMGVWNASA